MQKCRFPPDLNFAVVLEEMGKGEKREKSGGRRFHSESEEEQQQNRRTASQIEVRKVDSDDDDDETEANEDLSLKIVEKAMLRKCNEASRIDAGNFAVLEDDELVSNFVADDESGQKESKKKKRKKIESELEPVRFLFLFFFWVGVFSFEFLS